MEVVEVQFKASGHLIPVDHGYLLFSALSHLIPTFHGDDGIGVHPISGQLAGDRCMLITDHSFLTIRLPHDRLGEVIPLAGKALQIGEHTIRLSVPNARTLISSVRLYSRLVVIKGFQEPAPFLEAVQRQLDSLTVKGRPVLVPQPHVEIANRDGKIGSRSSFLRRTIRIRDKEVVGFALRVEELTAEESIILQETGIGGRRRFGCGVLIPDRR